MNAIRKAIASVVTWKYTSVLARLVLGGVLLVAGALKVGDPAAMVRSVRAYEITIWPDSVNVLIGNTLPLLEICVGVLLIVGLATRFAAALGGFFMVMFIAGISYVWSQGITIDCGCFGSGGEIGEAEAMAKYPWEIARDLGLLILAGILVLGPSSPWTLDRLLGLVVDDEVPATDDDPAEV